MLFLYIFLGLLGVCLIWTIIEIVISLSQKPIPDMPKEFLSPCGLSLVYYYLTNPDKIPEGLVVDEDYIFKSLQPTIDFINGRYDCADFRCQLLFRLYKDCDLPERVKTVIKKTFIDFKYHMDEPGEDSMCYWSENHQILFAVSEYLAGQEWQDEVFTNSGMTGREHMQKALKIINIWMEQKFKYGFFEWLSNNYYAENIAPMSNYIEYSLDKESVHRMKIIFDLLWFDVASHAVNNTFVAVSSRMYGDNKSSDIYGNRIKAAMDTIWGTMDTQSLVNAQSPIERQILSGACDVETTVKLVGVDAQMMQNFIAMYKKGFYKVPEVIYNIAKDQEGRIIKESSGLNTEELVQQTLVGQEYHQIMAQLGSEAFTNKEVIQNTLKYLSKNKMFRNQFVNPFRYINLTLLKALRIPKFISSKFNLMTNGIALGRGNIYCYRTKYYTLTTAMACDVDSCGAQAHIWTANISPDLAVYTTHPARDDDSREKHGASPGYWVGNGRQPMSVQYKNINLTIYKLPVKKRLLEFHIAKMTHIYMPKEKFDILRLDENYVFGKKGKVLIAIIANGKLKYRPFDEYAAALLAQHDSQVEKIQEIRLKKEFDLTLTGGEYHTYVTELSDTDKESFEQFVKRIKSNKIHIQDGTINYISKGVELYADYDKNFTVNGESQPLEYKRFESAYSVTPRNPDKITIKYQDKKLVLDYKNNIREETVL